MSTSTQTTKADSATAEVSACPLNYAAMINSFLAYKDRNKRQEALFGLVGSLVKQIKQLEQERDLNNMARFTQTYGA